jgi:hypothetical protein
MVDYVILVSIALLLTLGAFIALQSGSGPVARADVPNEGGLRVVAGNFSAMFVRVLVFLAILLAMEMFVGFPKIMLW